MEPQDRQKSEFPWVPSRFFPIPDNSLETYDVKKGLGRLTGPRENHADKTCREPQELAYGGVA